MAIAIDSGFFRVVKWESRLIGKAPLFSNGLSKLLCKKSLAGPLQRSFAFLSKTCGPVYSRWPHATPCYTF